MQLEVLELYSHGHLGELDILQTVAQVAHAAHLHQRLGVVWQDRQLVEIMPWETVLLTNEATHGALALDVQQQQIEPHEVLSFEVDPGQRYPQIVRDVLGLGAVEEK